MHLSSLLRDLVFDGQIEFKCPEGTISLAASKAQSNLDIDFDNSATFRYFLDTLPQNASLKPRQQLRHLEQLPQSIQIRIAGKTLLEKPSGDTVKIHYWQAGKQWLRWKTGQ